MPRAATEGNILVTQLIHCFTSTEHPHRSRDGKLKRQDAACRPQLICRTLKLPGHPAPEGAAQPGPPQGRPAAGPALSGQSGQAAAPAASPPASPATAAAAGARPESCTGTDPVPPGSTGTPCHNHDGIQQVQCLLKWHIERPSVRGTRGLLILQATEQGLLLLLL